MYHSTNGETSSSPGRTYVAKIDVHIPVPRSASHGAGFGWADAARGERIVAIRAIASVNLPTGIAGVLGSTGILTILLKPGSGRLRERSPRRGRFVTRRRSRTTPKRVGAP